MTELNKDYLRFDAYSIKKLLEQKLSEDTNYTDQIYPSSDLSIFIDIVSNAYQVMLYYLNQAGSEAIATDAQFYENINRIVKFLDYHPNGYSTSVSNLTLSDIPTKHNNTILPPYSRVDTDTYDTNGKQISFSTTDFYYVYDDTVVDNIDEGNIIPFHNGEWKMYELSFLSEGIPYETFVCKDLISDSIIKSYISFPYVHAFVKRGTEWMIFKPVTSSLFMREELNKAIGSDEKVFELRMNEYKQIELKFGDGIYAMKLEPNDEVYVAYLDSNGPGGIVDASKITGSSIEVGINGFNTETLRSILTDEISENLIWENASSPISGASYVNIYASSDPAEEETVEQIKEFAPKYVRSGGRLIMDSDFEVFIKSNYYKDAIDVKVMNNWEYMKTFLQWLYQSGIKNGDSALYLNPSVKSNYGYEWADSCDFNNVYLWIKMKAGYNIPKKQILRDIQNIKALTSEIVFAEPVDVNFIPCAYYPSAGYEVADWDPTNENFLEVKLSSNTLESPENIRTKINYAIIDYFQSSKQQLGAYVDFDEIKNRILSINGVERLRTVYQSGDTVVKIEGLSMAHWSGTVIGGSDVEIVNTSIKLEDFMFPQLAELDIKDRIRVVSETAYQTNQIEY